MFDEYNTKKQFTNLEKSLQIGGTGMGSNRVQLGRVRASFSLYILQCLHILQRMIERRGAGQEQMHYGIT